MTPGPGTSWPAELDLDYLDDERVNLDVSAIIAQGARIRSKRFLTRMAVVALICWVGPAAFTVSQFEILGGQPGASAGSSPAGIASREAGPDSSPNQDQTPGGPSSAQSPLFDGQVGMPNAGPCCETDVGTGPRGSEVPLPGYIQSPGHSGWPGAASLQPVQLVAKLTQTLPARYGPLRALVGAPTGGGVWYVGMSARVTKATKVKLFHLSLDGKVASWPVLAESALGGREAAQAPVGLAVSASGVAWLGVDTMLVRVNTKTGVVSSWSVPAPRAVQPSNYDPRTRRHQEVQSVALSLAGAVTVALSHSSGVQVLSPRTEKFHEILMPAVTDETEAVGYTRSGTLGVGYISVVGAHRSGVLMSSATGPYLTATVADARSVLPYRTSWLLVGIGRPDVVTATASVRPLQLPAISLDIAGSTLPPVSLNGNRLAVAVGLEILSFPAYARTPTGAAEKSDLYDTTPHLCPPSGPELAAYYSAEPPGGSLPARFSGCPQGYQLLATDQLGDFWVVTRAKQALIELLTVR